MGETKKPFISRAAIVKKPLPVVFSYLASMENMHELMINVVKMEKTTAGPIDVGTKFIESRNLRGNIVKADVEVIEYEENKRFAIRSNSNGLITEYYYTFDEVQEGTQVVMKGFITFTTFRMKFFKKYLIRTISKEDGYQMYYLKEMLDNPPVEYLEEEKKKEQEEIERVEKLEALLTKEEQKV